jgi:hypothetical protein
MSSPTPEALARARQWLRFWGYLSMTHAAGPDLLSLARELDAAEQRGAERERVVVVAWLREPAGAVRGADSHDSLDRYDRHLANVIERGEHLEKPSA